MRTLAFVTLFAVMSPAIAQVSMGPEYFAQIRAQSALSDIARAQDRQADSLQRLERVEHDRALREDRAARVANRDRRDAYRRRD